MNSGLPRRRAERGLSLAETLFAAGLTFLVFAVASAWLVGVLRSGGILRNRTDLQQSAALVLTRIGTDVRQSGGPGVSCVSAREGKPTVLALARQEGFHDGRVVWQNSVVVYWWTPSSRRLYRAERNEAAALAAPPSGQQPWAFDPAVLPRLVPDAEEAGQNLAQHVLAFDASLQGPERRSLPLTVELTLQADRGRPFTVRRSWSPRNAP